MFPIRGGRLTGPSFPVRVVCSSATLRRRSRVCSDAVPTGVASSNGDNDLELQSRADPYFWFCAGSGALVAFDKAGMAVAASSNATASLGPVPALGTTMGREHFDHVARSKITQALAAPEIALERVVCEGRDGAPFDLVMHWSAELLVVEWESRPTEAPSASHYASLVQHAILKLQRSASFSLEQLLQVATDVVRALSGFDRAMAYRFLPDGSGEVVAEALGDNVGAYLHHRFPATDIPDQARRLHVLNPIRHIADVSSAPVFINRMLEPPPIGGLDLTFPVLRSLTRPHRIPQKYGRRRGDEHVDRRRWKTVGFDSLSPHEAAECPLRRSSVMHSTYADARHHG